MANIITSLKNRMFEDRGSNKSYPTKTYKTEGAAEKALEADAAKVGKALDQNDKPADYVVFYVHEWGLWTGAVNLSEVLRRPTCLGGFVAVSSFYVF